MPFLGSKKKAKQKKVIWEYESICEKYLYTV